MCTTVDWAHSSFFFQKSEFPRIATWSCGNWWWGRRQACGTIQLFQEINNKYKLEWKDDKPGCRLLGIILTIYHSPHSNWKNKQKFMILLFTAWVTIRGVHILHWIGFLLMIILRFESPQAAFLASICLWLWKWPWVVMNPLCWVTSGFELDAAKYI